LIQPRQSKVSTGDSSEGGHEPIIAPGCTLALDGAGRHSATAYSSASIIARWQTTTESKDLLELAEYQALRARQIVNIPSARAAVGVSQ
jgi:hypothetical protein